MNKKSFKDIRKRLTNKATLTAMAAQIIAVAKVLGYELDNELMQAGVETVWLIATFVGFINNPLSGKGLLDEEEAVTNTTKKE